MTRSDNSTYTFRTSQTIKNGDKIGASTIANLDKVTGFGAGDLIITNATATPTANDKQTVQIFNAQYGSGTDFATGTTKTDLVDVFISGTLNSDGSFTFTNTGSASDTLYVFDSNGTTVGGDLYAIVLVGYTLGGKQDATTAGGGATFDTGLLGAALPS